MLQVTRDAPGNAGMLRVMRMFRVLIPPHAEVHKAPEVSDQTHLHL